ncbi:class I SAM-dependent methyltransferase [Marimonas lutisalis]|uniref:class I SAM-dependent methyltransferase n=1 Tax=Marimonas lutisalis TaxID=2545756 RepID=UPI0010F94856|nr:methyltransferase [Marimonas lutisalis]
MSDPRLAQFLEDGWYDLPEEGVIAVFGAVTSTALAALPKDRVQVISRLKPDYDDLAAAGFAVAVAPPGSAAVSVVFLPRAKAQARAQLAQAMALSGVVIVDGQKTDGVDSLLREMKKRAECSAAFSKAHGKTFVARGKAGDFADWMQAGEPREIEGGFETCAGVFSADGIDPASALLAGALPARLGAHVADLGAGWGYLARRILTHEGVETLDLVEADHAALDCARRNVADARARFHWADATRWMPDAPVDAVVMNPPFHEGRKGVPELGQQFIAAAARMLAPGGRLWMVANRHLPYEKALHAHFREVEEIGGDTRFKLFRAARPSRTRG